MKPRAFTLIELLVVIALIGVLVALLLPAVQAAREAARRTQCSSNMKHLGLALHNYHSLHNAFPPGRIWQPGPFGCDLGTTDGCQDTTWFCLLLPQLEQQPLANAFNYSLGLSGPNLPLPLGWFANATVTGTKIGLFQCPSDRVTDWRFPPQFYFYVEGDLSGPIVSRGNYGVCWGNTEWDQKSIVVNGRNVPFLPSAFGHDGRMSFTSVADGLSNTIFAAEILPGKGYDYRGDVWYTGGGCYMTRYTPNKFHDIYGSNAYGDVLALSVFCVDEPPYLPCSGADPKGNENWAYIGARSHHPGGIKTLLGDGSVGFVKETINPATWVSVHTIRNGEVIDSQAY